MMQITNDWSFSSPETALTLPSRYFFDPEVFQAERDRIFMSSWHLIGHKSELSEPGQFIVCDVFDQSVVATRGRDGTVHAFHNVCQHRGNRLVNERRGTTKGVFRCSYHSWCYGLDGSLRSAPRSERMVDFKKENYGIPPVRVEEFAGFLFFNLDPKAPSMQDTFPGAEATMIERFPDAQDVRLVGEKDFLVPANWKVIMDNNIEGYHFELSGPVHTVLANLISFEGYKLTPHERWWTYTAPANMAAEQAYSVPLDDEAKQSNPRFFNIVLWPHNTFYRFPFSNFLGTFLIIPTGAEESIIRVGYYVAGEKIPAVTEASIKWMSEELGPEDISLNITTQKGLRSLGYKQGRYMIDAERSNMSEHLVHHFHTLVYNAIRG
jgi:carnitine monooxygenase subunit